MKFYLENRGGGSMKTLNIRKISVLLTVLIIVISSISGCTFNNKESAFNVSPLRNSVVENINETPGASQKGSFSGSSPEGMQLVASNGNLSLHADTSTGEFMLEDLKSGMKWFSNPPGKDDETFAKGARKMELYSQIIIKDIIDESDAVTNTNSYIGSIRKSGVEFKEKNNGFLVTYTFPDRKISIPLEYTLEDDCLRVDILADQIVEEGEFRLYEISLLPYFCAAGSDKSGYFVLPDGSGSLMELNNGKTSSSQYRVKLYGNDAVFVQEHMINVQENAMLPFIGLHYDNNSLLAVVDHGATEGNVVANVSGQMTSYNNAYFTFETRFVDKYIIGVDLNQKEINRYDPYKILSDKFTVRYFPLGDNSHGYGGMAAKLREHLIRTYNVEKISVEDVPLFIDIYGAIREEKSVLGVPMFVTKPVTSFSEAGKIVEELNNAGCGKIMLTLNNWSEDGIRKKPVTNFDPIRKLGGKKGLMALLQLVNFHDDMLFLATEPFLFYKSGNGYSLKRDSARNISNIPAEQLYYTRNNFYPDKKRPIGKLLRPIHIPKVLNSLNVSIPDSDIGINPKNLASMVYSDYTQEGGCIRDVAADYINMALEDLTQREIIAQAPFYYALPYVNYVVDVPLYSSNFDITDKSIPFYQMVLHGVIPYATRALNHYGDQRNEFLKAVEYGAYLHYTFIHEDSSKLKDTMYDYLHAAGYEQWKETVIENQMEIREIHEKIGNSYMIEHDNIADGVYMSTYSNGYRVIVNYNDFSVNIGGNIVEAKNYALVYGGDK